MSLFGPLFPRFFRSRREAGRPKNELFAVGRQMRTFFINLDDRLDRRAFMEGQLQALGIAAERIGGVRPEEIDAELLKYQDAKKPGPYLAPPEIACALGHRKAWRRMLELDLPYALFLEDDSPVVVAFTDIPGRSDACFSLLFKLDVIRLETRMQRVTLGA